MKMTIMTECRVKPSLPSRTPVRKYMQSKAVVEFLMPAAW